MNMTLKRIFVFVGLFCMSISTVHANSTLDSCQAISPYTCRGAKTFQHLIQEGCLNQKKYKALCVQSFCEANCAVSPCAKSNRGKLCRRYCHDVALSDSALEAQMKRCLITQSRHPKNFSVTNRKSSRLSDYKDFDSLKKTCRQRDILFHVDGLRLGSSRIVTIAHFKENIDQAIHLTTIIHQILRKIIHGEEVSGIEMQAKMHLERSDEHAQYFANVTDDCARLCQKLRDVVELGHVQEKGNDTFNSHLSQDRKIHKKLMALMDARDRLFSIDSVTVPGGAVVRITDFMENVRRATELSYNINYLYMSLGQFNALTPVEKERFSVSNKRVITFVEDVSVLQKKNKLLIQALAKGEIYHS